MANNTGDDREDLSQVGYCRPPVKNQFKKGHSGNPKGRSKGRKSFSALVEEEINKRVTITQDGKQRSVTKGQVVAMKLLQKMATGDHRAVANYLTIQRQQTPTLAEQQPDQEFDRLLDEKAIQNFLNRAKGGAKK